ncbi:TolC family protein [Hippea maritima]|uniref:Outer membrane efflux protein n=1 Tax=Hippea maritima (strain ATCC 700847 / DSM 10411 / MH2) TaxID=760142 RepID=F2LY58_HIPMA|nr:TolC family protein [Hippea maritima]AEA34381.1 outer membrane efflux protein [Hippea maritima DSM 10411]
MRKVYLIAFFLFFSLPSFAKEVYTLNRAVNEAITNSYIIKEAIENQKAAKSNYKSSISSMLPSVDFSYNYTHLKDYPYSINSGTKMRAGDNDQTKWSVSITQPIFEGFALITQKEIAQLGVDISKIEKQKAILDVAENVKIAYFNILLAKKYLLVANEEVKSLKAHLRDAERLYKNGVIAYNDLLKSKVALANAIQTRTKARNDLKLAISSFNLALRKNINSDTDVADIMQFKSKTYNLNKLIDTAINKRPLLKELALELKQANLGIKLNQSSYYPHVEAFAKYEQKGQDVLANDNDYTNQHNAMVGVQIKWNIFSFGKDYYKTQQQKHKVFSLQEKINRITDNIKLQVKRAFLDLETAKENIKTAKEALKQAKENFRITNLQYQQQITTSTEVLDARSYLTQAEVNYYNALYGYFIALAKLQRTIGEK